MVPQLFEQRKCNMRSAVVDCNRPRRALTPECPDDKPRLLEQREFS